MIYSGLEFGQYFELERDTKCHNVLLALTPATRMAFIFIQMYFIFLNNEVSFNKNLYLKFRWIFQGFINEIIKCWDFYTILNDAVIICYQPLKEWQSVLPTMRMMYIDKLLYKPFERFTPTFIFLITK